MGYPSLGFRQGHIWVAKDEGLFAKYGLDVEPVFVEKHRHYAKATGKVTANKIDLGHTSSRL